MGTKRLFALCLLSGLAVSTFCMAEAQAQSSQSFDGSATQQAYYQPLTPTQYQQHRQATYVLTQSNQYQQGLFPSRLPTSSQPIQQRASELLQSEENQPHVYYDEGVYGRNASPFPRRDRNVGHRRLQEFGPISQNQDSVAPDDNRPTENNPVQQDQEFDPFADPPSKDDTSQDDPPNEGQDQPIVIPPLADDSPEESPQDTTKPPAKETPDSPRQDPEMQDPVLPGDAQFSPDPRQVPELESPNGVEPQPTKPDDVEYPPNAVKPGDQENQQPDPPPADAFKEPKPAPTQSPERAPTQGRYVPPDGIYRAPPVDNMPPIGQPNQLPSRIQPQTAPPLTPYRSQPSYPAYQPPFQPIPGIPAPPGYDVPEPEFVEAPPTTYVPATVTPDGSVYSNVVVDDSCDCQTCDSGCPDFYFSFFGGSAGLRDLDSQTSGGQIMADSGSGFGFALGRRNGRNLRTEIELSFRQNDITGFQSVNFVQPFDGELNSFSGMANAYWELIDVPTRCFKPYIGGGVGFVSVDTEIIDQRGQNMIPTNSDNDTSFAYQWMAGVNYKAYRNMDLFAEYRFFAADTFRIDTTNIGMSGRYDFKTDNVLLGFRWKF